MNYLVNYLTECFTTPVALIGLLASVIVLVSMCFDTSTRKGNLLLRSCNLIGSILSVIYGVMLGANGFGMLILNVPLVFVNLYYLFKKRGNKDVHQ